MYYLHSCARIIVNLWSICLGVYISKREQSEIVAKWATRATRTKSKGRKLSETLATRDNTPGRPFRCVCFTIGNNFLSKRLKTSDLPLRSVNAFLKASPLYSSWSWIFGLVGCLNLSISSVKFICYSSTSSSVRKPYKFLFQKILIV